MRRTLAALALIIAPLLPVAPAAHADTQTGPVGVAACADPTVALCDPDVNVPVQTGGLLQVVFNLSDLSCTSRIHLFVDAQPVVVTPYLNPGQSSGLLDLSPVSDGSHILGVQAEGLVRSLRSAQRVGGSP